MTGPHQGAVSLQDFKLVDADLQAATAPTFTSQELFDGDYQVLCFQDLAGTGDVAQYDPVTLPIGSYTVACNKNPISRPVRPPRPGALSVAMRRVLAVAALAIAAGCGEAETVRPAPLDAGRVGASIAVLAGGEVAVVNPDQGSVSLLDPVTLAPRVTVAVGGEPRALLELRSGAILVTTYRGGEAAVIDPASGQVTAHRAVCAGPWGLAEAPDGVLRGGRLRVGGHGGCASIRRRSRRRRWPAACRARGRWRPSAATCGWPSSPAAPCGASTPRAWSRRSPSRRPRRPTGPRSPP